MVNIIKQEVVIEESLKKKLQLICEFSNTNLKINFRMKMLKIFIKLKRIKKKKKTIVFNII